jgi:hypothetical protein
MPPLAWIAATIATLVVAAIICGAIAPRRRSEKPMTPQEHLAAARRAAAQIRREARRADRDHFEKGHGIPDRHSGAIAENAIYGDLTGGGGSSSSS